jgi:hypothetical protein
MSSYDPRSLLGQFRRACLRLVVAVGALYLFMGLIKTIALPLLVMGGVLAALWLVQRRHNGW